MYHRQRLPVLACNPTASLLRLPTNVDWLLPTTACAWATLFGRRAPQSCNLCRLLAGFLAVLDSCFGEAVVVAYFVGTPISCHVIAGVGLHNFTPQQYSGFSSTIACMCRWIPRCSLVEQSMKCPIHRHMGESAGTFFEGPGRCASSCVPYRTDVCIHRSSMLHNLSFPLHVRSRQQS